MNLYYIVIRRIFKHFDEEIIIEYYECIDDYERKVDVLCLYFHMEVKVFVEVCGLLEVVWCQKIITEVK